jgi:hypothetical protein
MSKMVGNKADKGKKPASSQALKVLLALLGMGLVAGTALVVTLDRIMKKIFVNEDWPKEEWVDDDWADEDLEI